MAGALKPGLPAPAGHGKQMPVHVRRTLEAFAIADWNV